MAGESNEEKRRFEEERRRERERLSAAQSLKETWEAISSEIFGISGAGFWENAGKSYEHVKKLEDSFIKIKGALDDTKVTFAKKMKEDLEDLSPGMSEILDKSKAFGKSFSKLTADDKDDFLQALKDAPLNIQELVNGFETTADKYEVVKAIGGQTLDDLSKMPSHIREAILAKSELFDISSDVHDLAKKITKQEEESAKAKAKMANDSKIQLNLLNGIWEGAKNFRNTAIKTAFEWDKVSNSIQRESGIMLSNLGESDKGFAGLSMRASEFTSSMATAGLSLAESGQFIGEIGEQLRTTSTATVDMAEKWKSISMATGISTKETAEIGGNLMKMGYSSESVLDYFEGTNKEARALGVNSRRVIQSINQNLKRMQSFGFSSGEESLKRMALRAEQLRIEIDEIFDVAERARTIEGAMDMAAQLQLAAGSFSNLNPMDLLSAARKGPDELQKILARMGSDIGNFNDKGEFQLDPIDGDRLRIVAEATGMKYESLFEMIRRNAMDTKKVGDVMSDSFFSKAAEGLDEFDGAMMKSAFSDLLEFKDGKLSITTEGQSLFDEQGITDWKTMSESDMKKLMEAKRDAAASLEEQARQNMDMRKSMDMLVASFANTMTVFQPWIETLTGVVTSFNKWAPDWLKMIIGGLVGISTIIGPLIAKGIGIAIASKFGVGIGGGLTSLAGGIKGAAQMMGETNMIAIAKFSAALAMVGAAIVGFSYAMSEWGGEASLKQMGTAAVSLVLLGGGLVALSKISKGIDPKSLGVATLAMLGVSVGIAAFGAASQQMNDVQWGSVLAGLGMFALTLAALTGIGFAVAAGGWVIAGLAGIGLAAMIATAGGLAIVGSILASAAGDFNKLANIDWSGFGNMGSALMQAAPGIAAFGLASMAFANPVAIFGMGVMVYQLSKLADVMNPLAISLEKGADSMERFVSSIRGLKSAVKDLDMSQLEEVKEIANYMEKASKNSAIEKLASLLEGFTSKGGGSSSSEKAREIKIRLYLPNGRELKHTILEDTAIQSGR